MNATVKVTQLLGANATVKRDLYLLTYLLTPCSRVLREKLTCSQLVNKYAAFYGTRKFITALKSARQLSLF
jgi:hypothetical protein